MAVAFTGATLLDGNGGDPRRGDAVVVEGDRIERVSSSGAAKAERIDLDGLTLVPGLIDAHVHLGGSPGISGLGQPDLSIAEFAAITFRHCNVALDAGFTTVRDTGGVDAGLVAAIERKLVRGPRVICCGPLLCQTGGHGHFAPTWEASCMWHDHGVPGLGQLSLLSDGPDEVRKNAREAFRRGARFIKMCVTGGVVSLHDRLSDTQFTVEEIRAAVVEASARGTYVTVHAHNNEGVRNAVEAGVKCIEHGTQIDEATARLLADRGVSHVPTLSVIHQILENAERMGLPASIRPRTQGTLDGMADAILAGREAGVRIGSGSDLIGGDQRGRGNELVLKSQILSPMEALVSATRTNAKILCVGDDIGTVEPGKLADLVAFEGNPLEKPELFNDPERIRLVAKAGEIVKDTR